MKAIINGLRYDTEKAICVGEASHNYNNENFDWWFVGLYKTPRSGKFFLAGEGGPWSMWARRIGDGRFDGEGIKALSLEDARKWAEKYLTVDEVEAAFSETIEDA